MILNDSRGCFLRSLFACRECLTGLWVDERVFRRCRGFAILLSVSRYVCVRVCYFSPLERLFRVVCKALMRILRVVSCFRYTHEEEEARGFRELCLLVSWPRPESCYELFVCKCRRRHLWRVTHGAAREAYRENARMNSIERLYFGRHTADWSTDILCVLARKSFWRWSSQRRAGGREKGKKEDDDGRMDR